MMLTTTDNPEVDRRGEQDMFCIRSISFDSQGI